MLPAIMRPMISALLSSRVYNPQLGNFMSGDPVVQDPENGQNYNRYSYVFNNPTNLTDPTGFLAFDGQSVCNIGHDCNVTSFSAPKAPKEPESGGEGTAQSGTASQRPALGQSNSANSGSYVGAKAATVAACEPGIQCQFITAKRDSATHRNAGNWTDNFFLKGNHIYGRISEPICRAPACDFKKAVQALNSKGVHPNQRASFLSGKPYRADVDIPGPFGEDHIKTTGVYDKDGNQIGVRNETMIDHALYPGVVERTIVRTGNEFRIRTEGGGYGYLGGPNISLPDVVWQPVDSAVAKELRK